MYFYSDYIEVTPCESQKRHGSNGMSRCLLITNIIDDKSHIPLLGTTWIIQESLLPFLTNHLKTPDIPFLIHAMYLAQWANINIVLTITSHLQQPCFCLHGFRWDTINIHLWVRPLLIAWERALALVATIYVYATCSMTYSHYKEHEQ